MPFPVTTPPIGVPAFILRCEHAFLSLSLQETLMLFLFSGYTPGESAASWPDKNRLLSACH